MNKFKKSLVYFFSFLSAACGVLQNYMATIGLLQQVIRGMATLGAVAKVFVHSSVVALAGVSGGIANFCLNVELLDDFLNRITNKPIPKLQGWQRAQYWLGSALFVFTGILFGLTAFVFSSIGALSFISIASGITVAGLMMIQELETWLSSFDHPAENEKTIWQNIKEWKDSLNLSKVTGIVIAAGNVLAISVLFLLGLVTFMTGIGIPILPALIIGSSLAFTAGIFTQFNFYNHFLSSYCENFRENFQLFWRSKYSPVGLITSFLNGTVNGVMAYMGVSMLASLLLAAGVAVPPVGVVIAAGVAAGAFTALASFIMGCDFWQRYSPRLPDCFSCRQYTDELEPIAECKNFDVNGTKRIIQKIPVTSPRKQIETSHDGFELERISTPPSTPSLVFFSSTPAIKSVVPDGAEPVLSL